MKIRITGLKKYQVAGTVQDENNPWIRQILNYEYQHGSPTGTGLSDWGYHTRRPKTLDEAVGYFQQDYLPKVQGLPMGLRERAGDFLYNTGEDARLYMLDQYVRQYENMPGGLADRGAYRAKGAKAGEFENLYGTYQSKIDALPIEERVKLMDAGRDYYYRNINTVNGQPSAAYNATWKPRLGIFGQYQAPKPVAPVAQPAAQATAPVVQQPVAQTREPYKIQTLPSMSVRPMQIAGNYNLPTLTALPAAPLIGPTGATEQTIDIPKVTSNNLAGTSTVAGSGNPFAITSKQWQMSDQEITDQANADLQMTNELSAPSTPANADAVFAQQLQQGVAQNNPAVNMKKTTSKKEAMQMIGSSIDSMVTAGQAAYAAFVRPGEKRREEARLRERNAQYNQQGENFMDRGNYGVGPTDYGLFRPNQMGVDSPEGQFSGGKFFAQMGTEVGFALGDTTMPYVDTTRRMPQAFNYADMMAPAMMQEAAGPAPVGEMASVPAGDQALREAIAKRESGGDYTALPPVRNGKRVSSAAGKYQFLWDTHKKQIAEVTGVTTKEQFLKNPTAQEEYFNYWNQNTLTPYAERIKKAFKPDLSTNQLKMLIHFTGPQGALDYFAKGKETRDALGTTTASYLAKLRRGGEYELTADEIMQIQAMGGDVEYI